MVSSNRWCLRWISGSTTWFEASLTAVSQQLCCSSKQWSSRNTLAVEKLETCRNPGAKNLGCLGWGISSFKSSQPKETQHQCVWRFLSPYFSSFHFWLIKTWIQKVDTALNDLMDASRRFISWGPYLYPLIPCFVWTSLKQTVRPWK